MGRLGPAPSAAEEPGVNTDRSASPTRAANTVMLVSHSESAGWRSNHSMTTASGFVRIDADSNR